MSTNIEWNRVGSEHVISAVQEYECLGATEFFARHGFAPTTTYDLHINDKQYPPKAVLGAAFELATGERLAPTSFEGGRAGAVKVLTRLGFDVRPREH